MRATQKKMMSKPVTSTEVGRKVASSGVLSGQPRVENGHSAEENQVSSTSSSWRSCFARASLFLRLFQIARDIDVAVLVVPRRDAVAPPQLARDAPVLDIVQPLVVGVVQFSGTNFTSPLATTSRPRLARPSIATYHWSVSIGSITRGCGRRAAPSACAAWSQPAAPGLRGRRRSSCAPRSGPGPGIRPAPDR